MKKLVLIISTLFFLPFISFSQNVQRGEKNTKLNMSRFIKLKQSSSQQVIVIEVDNNTATFEYLIETTVNSGELTVEILNPNGEREGIFSVGTQLSLVASEIAKGTITDSFSMPKPGEWKIIIKPKLASGEISIQHLFK